jgi:ABC-type transport system substrate-binding protein
LSDVAPNALRENEFGDNPIGSGPFKLRIIQDIDLANNRRIIHLDRNDNYYRGQSRIDRFQLHVYGTRDAIVKALSSGEVTAATDLTNTDIRKINHETYNVLTTPIQSGVYAILNTTKGYLKDKSVRKALQLGTDTSVIRSQLGTDIPALDLPFTDGQLTGTIPHAPRYDKKAAEKLLSDAGWKLNGEVREKKGVPLKISVVTTKDNDYERVLETLAGQWRSIGVGIDTLVIDPADKAQGLVQNVLQQRNYDVLLYQLSIGADPDVYAYWHSSQVGILGLNFSNYANDISDDALVSARSRTESNLRNNKYLTFARQWLADVPAIGLYQSTSQYVYSKSVQPYTASNKFVTPLDRYADILYWSVGSATVFQTP